MTSYLYSLLLISLAVALVGILTPNGTKDGIAKHMRLLCALLLIGVLILPIKNGIEKLMLWSSGEISLPKPEQSDREDYREEMQEALDNTSRQYVAQMLTQTLSRELEIPMGEVRCVMQWSKTDPTKPELVTLIFSGSAIWKDPKSAEAFVEDLLGCPCQSAIE